MGFSDQRLTNTFPSWARIRKDPSSYGSRFMSALAAFSENATHEIVKTSEMFKLFAQDVSNMTLREITLEEADYMVKTIDGWNTSIKYPTVVGELSTGNVTLSRATSIADFFYSVPDRMTQGASVVVDNWTVWESSSPTVYNSIDTNINGTPERLLIEISGSELYKREESPRASDKPFYGAHYIFLIGRDEDNNQIREYIGIDDDGFYPTENIFRELTSVEWDGFDGDVKITLTYKEHGMVTSGRIINKYDTGVLPDLSGPLAFYLRNSPTGGAHDGSCVAHLYSTAVRYRTGQSHRRAEIVDLDEELEEELGDQRLLDFTGHTYCAVGMAINPVDTRTYILDNAGIVHIYEPSLSPFIDRGAAASEDNYLDIVSLKDRVTLNENTPLWTWFRALVLPVQKVAIKRVKPDGVEEYLQPATLTWATTYAFFSGDIIAGKLPEHSWEDFRFYNTFDQLGQWDFYCEATFLGLEKIAMTSKTGVMCERLQAVKDFNTGLSTTADGIFFDKENYLCVSVGTTYHKYSLQKDIYLADFDKQRLLFRELYDNIEITYV